MGRFFTNYSEKIIAGTMDLGKLGGKSSPAQQMG